MFVLEWLASYGFLLAGGLAILSMICFLIVAVMMIKWHMEYVTSDYYVPEDEEDRRRRDNEALAIIGMCTIITCI